MITKGMLGILDFNQEVTGTIEGGKNCKIMKVHNLKNIIEGISLV